MPKFANSETIAKRVVKQLDEPGRGTKRTIREGLTVFDRWCKEKGYSLFEAGEKEARQYLEERSSSWDRETVDRDRQAVNKWLQHENKGHIPKSEFKGHGVDTGRKLRDEARHYTDKQVAAIQGRQTEKNSVATQVAREAGLRAKELITINRLEDQPPDKREWRDDRFEGRQGVKYSVIGKGGLKREVLLTRETAQRLEQRRLAEPITRRDREIDYKQHYNIGGGNAWSKSFTNASHKALGWSRGAHSLRHDYVQSRMSELQGNRYEFKEAKEIISQELGHFDPSKTNTYL